VISFHDEFDCVVPYGYGQVMSCYCSAFWYSAGPGATYGLLAANGICTERNTVTGSAQHCSYPQQFMVDRASCFMKRILCNSCVTQANALPFTVDSCDNLGTGILLFGIAPVSISASPNPATDWCSITFSEPTRGSGTICIYDVNGQLVMSQTYMPLTTEVHVQLASLAEGIYYAETGIAGQSVRVQFAVVR
jgi:hypothetical protein